MGVQNGNCGRQVEEEKIQVVGSNNSKCKNKEKDLKNVPHCTISFYEC